MNPTFKVVRYELKTLLILRNRVLVNSKPKLKDNRILDTYELVRLTRKQRVRNTLIYVAIVLAVIVTGMFILPLTPVMN